VVRRLQKHGSAKLWTEAERNPGRFLEQSHSATGGVNEQMIRCRRQVLVQRYLFVTAMSVKKYQISLPEECKFIAIFQF
jgi:hypothetical protein